MPNTKKVVKVLTPDILEHFYDLRALAMSASAMARVAEEDAEFLEINAIDLNA